MLVNGKNAFVTGAGGYLGSVLVEELLQRSYSVTAVDLFRHGIPSLAHLVHNKRLTLIRGDARDTQAVWYNRSVQKASVVFPLAALVGAAACDREPIEARDTNLTAVSRLVEEVLRPWQIVVYPNTNSGYGKGGAGLTAEDQSMSPLSLYGRLKVEAEQCVLRHYHGISLRLATLFGASPRMRLDLLVNDFVLKARRQEALALFEPHYRRSVLHVRDAARAFVHAAEHALELRGQAYNVAAENVTKEELCQHIKQVLPTFTWVTAAGADPDQRDYSVSTAKISATGFACRYTLDNGIPELNNLYSMPYEGPYRNA